MSRREILEEVKDLQKGIRLSAERLALLAKSLHLDVRKSAMDDNTAKLVVSTKAWFRLAALLLHGVKRFGNVDVSLGDVVEEKKEPKAASRKTLQYEKSSILDDIEALYGPGVIYGDS